MSLSSKFQTLSRCVKNFTQNPRESVRKLAQPLDLERGDDLVRRWGSHAYTPLPDADAAGLDPHGPTNPLREYFESVTDGAGIWKWWHYFEVYHRHLQKFIGRPVTVVEVGVYSGGSMPMWRKYFGDRSRIHGVDIEEACRVYENEHTTIHIGDQADRVFWKRFRELVPEADVLIDDGGHEAEQQMVTMEEMLPFLRPGGVYICEDVTFNWNRFAAFCTSLALQLNNADRDPSQELAMRTTPFQADVHSMHLYPFVVVVEKRDFSMKGLAATRRGTQWQPFFDSDPSLNRSAQPDAVSR